MYIYLNKNIEFGIRYDLSDESHDQTTTFIGMLYLYTFVPLINRPSYVTSSATVIHNIFTNNHNALARSYKVILVTDLSDHSPIFHISDSFTLDIKDVFIVKRSFPTKINKLIRMTWQ